MAEPPDSPVADNSKNSISQPPSSETPRKNGLELRRFVEKNFLGLAILAAAIVVSGTIWLIFLFTSSRPLFRSGGEMPAASPTILATVAVSPIPLENKTVENKSRLAEMNVGDLPLLGNPAAKVTIVEFGDYQCPFCRKYFQTVEPRIREEYIKTGKVKFAWRDLALLGPESVWAAEAARCANDQGKFWKYHDLLFLRQGGENVGAFSKDNLKKFAAELKLDISAFNQCLDSEKYKAAVEADTRRGKNLGVSGTPTTFINDKIVVGALPYEQIKEVIEQALQN